MGVLIHSYDTVPNMIMFGAAKKRILECVYEIIHRTHGIEYDGVCHAPKPASPNACTNSFSTHNIEYDGACHSTKTRTSECSELPRVLLRATSELSHSSARAPSELLQSSRLRDRGSGWGDGHAFMFGTYIGFDLINPSSKCILMEIGRS